MGKGEAVLRGATEPRAFVARGTRVGGEDIELLVEAEDREGRGIGRRSRGASGEVERRDAAADSSDERRVGRECVSKCRSRWAQVHYKKNSSQRISATQHEESIY